MKLYFDQLKQHLQHNLAAMYFISGDDTILLEHACHLIRQQALAQGFTHRDIVDVTSSFDWQQFLTTADSYHLFHNKKIIELRFTDNTINKTATTALLQYLQHPNNDNLLLITCSKLSSSQQRSNWYQTIEKQAVVVPIWPLATHQLKLWVKFRLQQQNMSANEDALDLLVSFHQGNLLALEQTISRLSLLYGNIRLTREQLTEHLTDNASYTIFDLVDATLTSDVKLAAKILSYLRENDIAPLLILWAMVAECRTLITIKYELQQNKNIESILFKNKVIKKRYALVKQALTQHSLHSLQAVLEKAYEVDLLSKGLAVGYVWMELKNLLLLLAPKHSHLQQVAAC